jgi:hypothetical protein
MAVVYNKSNYLAHQTLLWGALFCFALILGYAFLKDIFISPDVLPDLSLRKLILLVVGVFISVMFAVRFHSISKLYGSGRHGEEAVLKELQKLPDDYVIFHGIQLPGMHGDVDFIVVSPHGACTIEAKNHSSSYNLDLERVLRQSKNESMALKRFIKKKFGHDTWINSILVFANPRLKINTGVAHGVTITRLNSLVTMVLSGFASQRPDPKFDSQELVQALKHL